MTIDQALDQIKQLEKQKRYHDALKLCDTILESYPQNLQAIFKKGKILAALDRFKEALQYFESLLDTAASQHVVHVNIGDMHNMLNDYEKAVGHYLKTIEIKPDFEDAYAPAYRLMERLGRIEEANQLINSGLKIIPNNSDLHALQAKTHYRDKAYEKAERSYQKAIELGLREIVRPSVLTEYALVKEKLHKYDEAFALAEQAQTAAKQSTDLDKHSPHIMDDVITASKRWFTKEHIINSETHSNAKETPIFLVGFPRSGTTLMEQILFAHENLVVTDEIGVLIYGVNQLERCIGRKAEYPDDLNSLSTEEIQFWINEYYKNMEKHVPNIQGQRIVDKNPMSFLYLGAIHRFFPESPIIMMIRDPRDVVLSCFFQNFAHNSSNAHFYSLEDTANYYDDCMSLYLQYKENLGLNILEVKYEQLCSNFEAQARTIFAHIGEDWQDSVLHFYEDTKHRYIQTPSYDAVTEKINTKAVGKWHNYQDKFKPILPTLDKYLEKFGYQ